MGALEKIKQGILNNDLRLISDGYFMLTGETIEIDINLNIGKFLAFQSEVLKAINILRKIAPISGIEENVKNTNLDLDKRPSVEQKIKEHEYGPVKFVENNNKKTHYGNEIKVITDENVPQEEIEKNKEKAAKVQSKKEEIKRERSKNKKKKIKCNECLEFFETNSFSGDYGQKCKKCLNKLIKNRKNG